MNKSIKKHITIILAVVMAVFSLSACATGKPASDGKLKIVTTIFPEYDWVKQILGDEANRADITMLLDNGVDLHSYQPTAADIMKISQCDLFIYVGGESDKWVEDVLKEATNSDMKVINLLEVLGDSVKEEEVVEGMQKEEHHHHDEDGEEHEGKHEHEDEHEHEDGHEHEDEHEHEDGHEHEDEHKHEDEHVWLSLKNANVLCQKIADTLIEMEPKRAESYRKNLNDYVAAIDALDTKYENVVKDASHKTILFGDRFPFRYLTDDYHLEYYAAFVGCSAETEASFETITFLAGKTDELSLNTIFTLEKSNQKIAKTIVDNTAKKNQKIVSLDSMQSTTTQDIKSGASYLDIMESNLEALKEAIQ